MCSKKKKFRNLREKMATQHKLSTFTNIQYVTNHTNTCQGFIVAYMDLYSVGAITKANVNMAQRLQGGISL